MEQKLTNKHKSSIHHSIHAYPTSGCRKLELMAWQDGWKFFSFLKQNKLHERSTSIVPVTLEGPSPWSRAEVTNDQPPYKPCILTQRRTKHRWKPSFFSFLFFFKNIPSALNISKIKKRKVHCIQSVGATGRFSEWPVETFQLCRTNAPC